MPKFFYTADTHFQHSNIIKYCGRTIFMNSSEKEEYAKIFEIENEEERKKAIQKMNISNETIKKHNDILIKNINERVKKDDTLIMNGDFCYKGRNKVNSNYFEKQINAKVIFVLGNHDRNNKLKTKIYGMVIREGGRKFYIVHDPRHVNFNYEINLTAHAHDKWECRQVSIDNEKDKFGCWIYDDHISDPIKGHITHLINIGVDVWDYKPVTINEIMSRYWRWRNKYKN